MKKLMLLAGGVLMMATITFAQDSTNIKKADPTPMPEQTVTTPAAGPQDMLKITSTDLPDAVKQTLGAPQYQGWESAPIYRSKNNDMYVIEMKNGTEAKSFKFGADGKPILE
ncbi:MAG: hypothetical protein ABIS36_06935 [Chryseolinea sp.]